MIATPMPFELPLYTDEHGKIRVVGTTKISTARFDTNCPTLILFACM